MKKTITLKKDSNSLQRSRIYSSIYNSMWSWMLLLIVFAAGCKKDEFKGEVVGLCPIVVSTDPMDKAVDVALNKVISATFNTDMKASTINNTSFIITQGTTVITGTVAPTADKKVFTFTPSQPLMPFVVYKGTITTGATDTLRTAMDKNYVWTFTTIPQVTVTFGAGGTASPTFTAAQGSTVTVSADPFANFEFVNWTSGGIEVSKSPDYTFTMDGNRALVANFAAVQPGRYVVKLSSAPAVGGGTSGSGSYVANSLVTVSASPNTGYTFAGWKEGANVVSTSSSYQFVLTGNRTLVATFTNVPATQFAIILSSNPAAGGMTDGEGAYPANTSRTVIATPNSQYNFVNWTEGGTQVSTSASYTFNLSASRTLVANFALKTFTLITPTVNGGTVTRNNNNSPYNPGTIVRITAEPSAGYEFVSWSGNATGSTNPLNVTMNANKTITPSFALIVAPGVGPGPVVLGRAGDFSILTKSGISSTGITAVEGDIGVSPAAATAITGFALIMDTNGQSSHTTIPTHVTGSVYASDYAPPTPSELTVAISNMETAYTTANNLVTPAPVLEAGAGNITGLTLAPGLYKWSTGVLIAPSGIVTLSGGANDTWVFQIAQDLTLNSMAQVKLLGGAQAKNITWVVAGQAVLGTDTKFFGNILSKTLISLNTRAVVTGRLLAQTAVTLNTATVNMP